MAAGVWQREEERGRGAYSGSCGLTTRKEQGEAAGAEPRAQAGQPRRGWAGAGRPGTLTAFGAWERPQRLGGGEANDPGSTERPLPTRGREPKPGCTACPQGFGVGDRRTHTAGFAVPNAGRRLETPDPLLPRCLSGPPALRGSVGLPYSQSLRFKCAGCPSRSSFPSFPSPRSLQSLPSAQFSLRWGSKPLGFCTPKAMGGWGASFREDPGSAHPSPPRPGLLPGGCARTPGTAGDALPPGAPGPRARAGSPAARGSGQGRVGAATQPGGGGAEGGREPASERASERGQLRP